MKEYRKAAFLIKKINATRVLQAYYGKKHKNYEEIVKKRIEYMSELDKNIARCKAKNTKMASKIKSLDTIYKDFKQSEV